MAIQPIQFPTYQVNSAMDFSGLERLGEAIRQGRINDMRQQALQQYGQGNPQALLQSGDLQLANLYAMDKQRTEAGARDVRDFAFRQQEAERAQRNAEISQGLQRRGVELREDPTPAGFRKTETGVEPIPGGEADPAYIEKLARIKETTKAPRQMSVTDISKLSEEGGKLGQLTGFAETFKPEYGGHIMVGQGANIAGRYLPESVTPEAWSKGAQWWQGYDRFKNVVRHELYGAALTANEQRAFEAADITPGMDPKVIKANLDLQKRIVERAIARKADALTAQGYSPDVIARAYGLKNPERVGAPTTPGASSNSGWSVEKLP